MRLLSCLFAACYSSYSTLYEAVDGSDVLRFKNDTEFYIEHEEAIRLGDSSCQNTLQLNLDNGDKKAFPGVYWKTQDNTFRGKVIDYEKCVYFISGAKTNHSGAELTCEASITSKCGLECKATLVSVHTAQQDTLLIQSPHLSNMFSNTVFKTNVSYCLYTALIYSIIPFVPSIFKSKKYQRWQSQRWESSRLCFGLVYVF